MCSLRRRFMSALAVRNPVRSGRRAPAERRLRRARGFRPTGRRQVVHNDLREAGERPKLNRSDCFRLSDQPRQPAQRGSLRSRVPAMTISATALLRIQK